MWINCDVRQYLSDTSAHSHEMGIDKTILMLWGCGGYSNRGRDNIRVSTLQRTLREISGLRTARLLEAEWNGLHLVVRVLISSCLVIGVRRLCDPAQLQVVTEGDATACVACLQYYS